MLEFLVSKVAMMLTLGMFSTGIHTVQKIRRKGTGDTPILPFCGFATACFIWLNYGIITSDGTLAFTNLVGTMLNCSYILLYYWYAPNKNLVYKTVAVFLFLLAGVHMYSAWYHTSPEEAKNFLGSTGVLLTIGTFASPFAQMKIVIEKKSSESMSFPLSVMVLAQCLMWWWYGYLIDDFFVQFPNVCGTILALVQLGVIMKYWDNQPMTVSSVMDSV